MSETHTALRSMHDLGLAAWFGGSLMGALGVNSAATKVNDPSQRLPVASAGWARWTPVNAAAIGAHLTGAVGELVTESPRMAVQRGVGRASTLKTGLTLGALAVTGYSRLLGMRLEKAGGPPVDGTTEPNSHTPANVASCQRQMKLLQWAVPVLTGALVVVTAYMGEQQKPGRVFRGMLARVGMLGGAPRTMGKMAAISMATRRMAMRGGPSSMPKTMGKVAALGMAKRRMAGSGR
ncbi:hypothetical protein ACFY2R_04215 [Micromonospora olivasterospora]|uniref:Uncharacterized protein n=1 Tax=Micromonospora olivasterospora TaxID=1880 RepID=A0A562IEE8_MICOL|nr:hypothetical protein [Micromonospora olivasterospora]TWH69236.1 hypothetical protein JD77_04244 [Micromonospora olivasterospora]